MSNISWKLMENVITIPDKLKLVKFILTTDKFTNGDKVKELENEWNNWLGSKHSLFVSSGSTANFLLIASIKEMYGLKPGDKVLVPACTWMTNVAPIMQLGLTPIFCDIQFKDFSFDHSELNHISRIHPDIKLIFVTHLLGYTSTSRTSDIFFRLFPHALVIDDVCESHGCLDNYGDKIGANSLGATFSSYWGHHMSVSPDTPIPYLNNENIFKIDSIKNIYEKYNQDISKIKIISFDENNNTTYVAPYGIIKHKIEDKRILKLSLSNNRNTEITEDHSVFSYDKTDFKIIQKRGNEIKPGDYLVVPSKLPFPEKVEKLDFLSYSRTKNNTFFVRNYDEKDLASLWFKWNSKENKNKGNWKRRGVLPIEHAKTIKENLLVGSKNAPYDKYIPSNYKITPDLCRLIGYFLAEGSYGKSTVNLSFHMDEVEYIEDVRNIIKSVFNLKSRVHTRNNCTTVIVSSMTLRIFFEDFLEIKRGAHNKRIPSFIFQAENVAISSFLYGYFAGDGTKKSKTRISVTSVSKHMINDVSYLFSMLGIKGSIIEQKGTMKKIVNRYTITKRQYSFVVNYVKLNKDKEVEVLNPNIKKGFPVERYSKRKGGFVEYKYRLHLREFGELENVEKFLSSDLMLLQVKSIEEIVPPYDEVYDFCVPKYENFIGGWQPICFHNSTVEGGFVSTNNTELYDLMKMKRSHGMARESLCYDEYAKQYPDVDKQFLFITDGYNFRNTEIAAVLGLSQLERLTKNIQIRNENHKMFADVASRHKTIFYGGKFRDTSSSFCFPMIFQESEILEQFKIKLRKYNIEYRPIVSGNLLRQPFLRNMYLMTNRDYPTNVDILHEYGIYLGNNQFVNEKHFYLLDNILGEL